MTRIHQVPWGARSICRADLQSVSEPDFSLDATAVESGSRHYRFAIGPEIYANSYARWSGSGPDSANGGVSKAIELESMAQLLEDFIPKAKDELDRQFCRDMAQHYRAAAQDELGKVRLHATAESGHGLLHTLPDSADGLPTAVPKRRPTLCTPCGLAQLMDQCLGAFR